MAKNKKKSGDEYFIEFVGNAFGGMIVASMLTAFVAVGFGTFGIAVPIFIGLGLLSGLGLGSFISSIDYFTDVGVNMNSSLNWIGAASAIGVVIGAIAVAGPGMALGAGIGAGIGFAFSVFTSIVAHISHNLMSQPVSAYSEEDVTDSYDLGSTASMANQFGQSATFQTTQQPYYGNGASGVGASLYTANYPQLSSEVPDPTQTLTPIYMQTSNNMS